jgi:predicted RNase H-like HicB family nuclease
MLTDYIQAAMRQAKYEILEDGSYYGEIPPCRGVWFGADNLTDCVKGLQEVLEDWLLLGFKLGHQIPVVDGIDLNLPDIQEEVA